MKYSTVAKLIALNFVPIIVLFFGWVFGGLQLSIAGGSQYESTYVIYLIIAIFIAAMVMLFYRAKQVDDELTESSWWVGQSPDFIELSLDHRLQPIVYMGYSLVVFGLIGTVIGFIFGLNGIDPEAMGDLPTMISSLGGILQGVGIAYYTTLVGSIGDIWLGFNILIVAGALNRLRLRALQRQPA